MQPLRSPAHDGKYPDRDRDCRAAIEHEFQQLTEHAISAGWQREEIAAALINLADNNAMAIVQDGQSSTNALLEGDLQA